MVNLASNNDGDASCVLDRNVMNEHTISDMTDIGLSMFAPLCGKNRGVFVLDPPDGQTYGCISFPPKFALLAGAEVETNVTIEDANAINDNFLDGNITAAATVDLLDFFLKNVYRSTPHVDEDPYACDAGGLAKLLCDRQNPSLLDGGSPVRAATLAGVFVPAPWATGGKEFPLDEALASYSKDDFEEMKKLGLNTVQIPVPLLAFDGDDRSVKKGLTGLMSLVEDAELRAILVLVGADDEEAVGAAATYASGSDTVVAMTLPSMDPSVLAVARASAAELPLLLPANKSDLLTLQVKDKNTFASLDMTHNVDIEDVASSNSVDDRMKQFYHEAIACATRSPIEYALCYRDVPVLISTGFDLSIDDCVSEDSDGFKDYGQCGRFEETIGSEWWENHRRSFAERQVFAYERGLGWSFATWKLLHTEDDKDSVGIIDSPAKLLSLRDVAAAGLMPSLGEESPAPLGCLNPPVADFILGDDTLPPTPAPQPDCGNGWWNVSIQNCTYWVPPTPTVLRSANPVPTNRALAGAVIAGGSAVLALGAVFLKIFAKRKVGYTRVPESNV